MHGRRRTCGFAALGILMLATLCGAGAGTAHAQEVPADGATVSAGQGSNTPWMAMAIAISIGTSCLGAGYAVGRVGAAALGAASEKPELITRSLLFVALAEGIAIYGLLIAVLLWIKL